MLEFEILQELETNAEILKIIKDYEYRAKSGRIKHLKATNLQFIEPTEYLITYPTTLTILSYHQLEPLVMCLSSLLQNNL